MINQGIISSTVHSLPRKMLGMETTGDRIEHVRKMLGLTQAEFADRIKVSRGAVGNWESNKGITQKNLQRISDIYGCNLDWLLTGKGSAFLDEAGNPSNRNPASTNKFDRTLWQVAHDMARRFEERGLGELESYEDFAFIVEKYYEELLTRKKRFENGSEEEH